MVFVPSCCEVPRSPLDRARSFFNKDMVSHPDRCAQASPVSRPSLEELHQLWATFCSGRESEPEHERRTRSTCTDQLERQLHEMAGKVEEARRTVPVSPAPPSTPSVRQGRSPKEIKDFAISLCQETCTRVLVENEQVCLKSGACSPAPPTVARSSQIPGAGGRRWRKVPPPLSDDAFGALIRPTVSDDSGQRCDNGGEAQDAEMSESWKNWQARRQQKQERAKRLRCSRNSNRESYGTWIKNESRASRGSPISRCPSLDAEVARLSHGFSKTLRECGLMALKLAQPAGCFSYRSPITSQEIDVVDGAPKTIRKWEAHSSTSC